jgi:drug/metabolite transporter (DMT)-like permease
MGKVSAELKKGSPKTSGLVAINIAAVVFGSTALFGKIDISPLWLVAGRAGFAALTLSIISIARGKLETPNRESLNTIIATGLVLAFHWLTFFVSVQKAGVAIATLTFATFPLFTVVMENLRRRQMPKPVELAIGAVIVIAVRLLVDVDFGAQDKLLGTAAGLASGCSFAWFGIASKRLGAVLAPLRASLYQNLVVTVALLPFLFFTPPPVTLRDWALLAALGVIATALMHQLYFYALRRLSAATCSGFVALEPVYAILFAAALFAEPVTYKIGLSALLIVGASLMLLKLEKSLPEANPG